MKRPYVQAVGINKQEELTKELMNHLSLFQKYRGIAGIMLDGGISRGFADSLSEIDVVIFLHQEEFDKYKNASTPTALGITMIDNYLYDIKLNSYEEEWNRKYDQVGLWDMSYAKILYDPNGELQKLFDYKLNVKIDFMNATGELFDAWWHYRLAGDIWVKREDTMQGHFVLNEGITPLLSVLYIINQEFVPHEKWIIHMSHSLNWLPTHYEEQLSKIICIMDSSISGLLQRQQAFERLWNELNTKLCDLLSCPKGINATQLSSYNGIFELYQKGSISLSEWNLSHSLGDLNYDPLNKLAKVENNNIIFRYDILDSLSENDMYSWFYEITNAIKLNQ